MLMIGYNTIDEAVDKGILSYGDERSIELHFNFNKSFEKILLTVPFGRHEKQKKLTDTIDYK